VVLYSDPAEDGYPYGEVYPRGNWRPAGAIMRRSIISLPYEGDPLSPGWASRPGAKRLRPEDVALPGIPVLSISYRSAQRILELLAGPVAPAEWQGRLPVTYRIGPGPAKLRVRTEMDNRDRPMLNVVGRLEGQAEPDQWVIVSNHHDAWIFGAGDPSSGTAALLELARGLGELAKRECRPRRTVVVAFWDAEEMLLGGSTEWVEDLEGELLEKAVAAINMDSAVFNPDRPLSVAAHPVLHRLFREVTRNVRDPRTGRSTFDVWRDLQNRYREVPGVDGWGEFFDPGRELTEPWVFEAPYDDAYPFYSYLALPASDMYYGADYGMYHSIYENIHWMKTVVDPTFEYHSVMAQIQGLAAMRLANAELLPLDFAEEARYWRRAYRDLEAVASNRGQKVPGIQEALDLIDRWESEAEAWRRDAQRFLAGAESPPDLAEVNLEINRRARDFLRPAGRPDAPNERNLFFGSSYDFEGVSGSTLPGIRFNLDRGRVEEAEREAALYLEAIRRRVQGVVKLRQEMREVR
jgi:N-acetylated-alpha-linked acidic dipeptidase